MKLYMKQQVFSWRDRFNVKDENGNDRYIVEGEILTLGKKLHVYHTGGGKSAYIRQKVPSLLPRYFVEIGGRPVCAVVKEFTLLKPRYRIEGLSWHMEGDYWAHEYSLLDGGRQVMRLSKKWFSWGDSYELDIADPRDELPCLCVALAVDCALAAQNSGAAFNG
jgi:uncharacterized protein YxjI